MLPPPARATSASRLLRGLAHGAIVGMVFFAGWWWRPLPYDVKRALPYYAGFFVFILAALAILVWFAAGLPGLRDALRDRRRLFLFPFLAFTMWIVLSPAWARYDQQSLVAAQQFAVVAFVAVMTLCAGPPPRALLVVLAATLCLQALVILAQFQTQGPLGLQILGEFEVRPGDQGLSVVAAGPLRLMRPYGLTVHPNVAGGMLAAALAGLAAVWAARGVRPWQRTVIALAILGGFWALLATFSRSAWGALLVGVALIALAALRRRAERPRFGHVALLAGALLLVAGLFVAAYPDLVLARAGAGAEDTELISIGTRQIFYDFAGQIIARTPLIGTGTGTFPWEARDLLIRTSLRTLVRAENVHSVPLLLLSDVGVVGAALWLAALGAAAWLVWRHVFDLAGIGCAAAAGVFLAAGVLDHYPWTMFPISLCAWILLGSAVYSARSAPDAPRQGMDEQRQLVQPQQ